MAIVVGTRLVSLSNSTAVSAATTGYIVHTFSTPGSTSFTPIGSGRADILIVGGGGNGGTPGNSGGAGGGGVVYLKNIQLTSGVSYPIRIGAGGGAPFTPTAIAPFGLPTIFTYSGITTFAGGGAGGGQGSTSVGGSTSFASGGGGTWGTPGGFGADVLGMGFPGTAGPPSGAPGGGSGSNTHTVGFSTSFGGIGVPYTISGTNVFYGGGGAGAANPGAIHPTSSTSLSFGLGGCGLPSPIPSTGNPGCIIVRFIG